MSKFNLRLRGPTSGPIATRVLGAALVAGLFLRVPTAQADPEPDADFSQAKTFACGHTGQLHMLINERFAAVVVSPAGQRFTLSSRPVEQGLVRNRWSDGVRTLTWDPGVQITWQDGRNAKPVACSREGGHRHGAQEVQPDRRLPSIHDHAAGDKA